MMFLCLISCASIRSSIARKEYKVVYNYSEYIMVDILDIEEVLEKKLSMNLSELYRGGLYVSITDGEVSIDSLKIKKHDGTSTSFYNEIHRLNKKFKPNVKSNEKVKLLGKTIHAHKLMVWTNGK